MHSGLFLITVGMLVQWPTIVTVATWPILIGVYYRLARREERDAECPSPASGPGVAVAAIPVPAVAQERGADWSWDMHPMSWLRSSATFAEEG